jgi:hypothetical protein
MADDEPAGAYPAWWHSGQPGQHVGSTHDERTCGEAIAATGMRNARVRLKARMICMPRIGAGAPNVTAGDKPVTRLVVRARRW